LLTSPSLETLFLLGQGWVHLQKLWGIAYRCIILDAVIRTFCATESTKELGTREKSLQAPFAHAAKGEPSVGHLLATPGFRLFSGCCGTCFVRIYKKIYTRTKLQTVLTQWPENSRPCVGFFNGAVSPSATDYLLVRIAYSKTTAAPHNFSSAQW